MKQTNYGLSTSNYLKRFKKARAKRSEKLVKLPFAKKIAIIEKMQADHEAIEKSIQTLK
jgi:hypothetical protein